MLQTDQRVHDVHLCGDVADALKHAILTRDLDARQIRENDAVLVLSNGFGDCPGAKENTAAPQQVIVVANSGDRASQAYFKMSSTRGAARPVYLCPG